jgi:hypothetical protein
VGQGDPIIEYQGGVTAHPALIIRLREQITRLGLLTDEELARHQQALASHLAPHDNRILGR